MNKNILRGLIVALLFAAVVVFFWNLQPDPTSLPSEWEQVQTENMQGSSQGAEKQSSKRGSSKASFQPEKWSIDVEEPESAEGKYIYGIVREASSGMPLEAAEVRMISSNSRRTEDSNLVQMTDRLGRFLFDNLESGAYAVYAHHEGRYSFKKPRLDQILINDQNPHHGPVELRVGNRLQLGVQVVAAETLVPIEGAQVRLVQIGLTHYTDANGWTAMPVVEGVWLVKVKAEGFGTQFKNINVSGDREVVITMKQGASISGVVTNEEDLPVPDVEVTLYTPDYQAERTTTDGDGRFLFAGCDPDAFYSVMLRHIKYDYQTHPNLKIPNGQRQLELEIQLQRLKQSGIIEGRVQNTDGEPIANAEVTYGDYLREFKRQTDETGYYLFEESIQLSSRGELRVRAEGYATQVRSFQSKATTQIFDFVMTPAKTFKGRVIDGDDRPLEGVRVYTKGSSLGLSGNEMTVTDAKGHFELLELSNELDIRLHKSGYRTGIIDKPFDYPTPEAIVLHSDQVFFGQVVDEQSGEPIEAFSAKVTSGIHFSSSRGIDFESEQGHFQVSVDTRRRGFNLVISSEGYPSKTFEDLNPSEERQVLTMSADGDVVAGTLLSKSGQPIPRCKVELITYTSQINIYMWLFQASYLDRGERTETMTDSQGRFRFEGVPETRSRYLVIDTDGWALTASRNLADLSPEEQESYTFRVVPEGVVDIQINRERFPEAEKVWLTHNARDYIKFHLPLTRDQTRAQMKRLPSGTYTARLTRNSIQTNSFEFDRATLDIDAGATHDLMFGFGETYQISGVATCLGEPIPNGILVLKSPSMKRFTLDTVTDHGGRFVFEDLESGEYELYYHRQESLNSGRVSHLKDKQSIRIWDQDVVGQWDFELHRSLIGRIANQEQTMALVLSKEEFRRGFETTSLVDGTFQFDFLPQGTYNLEVRIAGNKSNILLSQIELDDRERGPLDVGDVFLDDEGQLQVQLSQDGPQSRMRILVYHPDTTNFSRSDLLAEDSLSLKLNPLPEIKELPTGLVKVKVDYLGKAWKLTPEVTELRLVPNQTIPLRLRAEPFTWLYAYMDNAETIAQARLHHLDSGNSFYLAPAAEVDKTQRPAAWVDGRFLYAIGIAEGNYRLEVQTSAGRRIQKTVEVILGKAARVRLTND